MFSKSKPGDTPTQTSREDASSRAAAPSAPAPASPTSGSADVGQRPPGYQAPPKASPSLLSSDLTIKGNIQTAGDIQIEGTIEGDVRAHLLTVGEGAHISGEIMADDVVVNGKVVGRVRGLKVRLTSTAQVEGDIIHKTIAIESGAHFEGSVQRRDDPLASETPERRAPVQRRAVTLNQNSDAEND